MTKKSFLIAMLAVVTFTACQPKQGGKYSCIPEVNEWVIKNISDIQNMTRLEWLNVDDAARQRAIFIALTPTAKQQFWLEKLTESLDFDWSDAEKMHINELIDTVKACLNWFEDEKPEKILDEYELFRYKWVEFAKENLLWSDKQIVAVAASGYPMKNKLGELQINKSKHQNTRLKKDTEPSCDCHPTESYTCSALWGEHCASSSTCNATSFGCGLLWLAPCVGLCKK